MASRYLMAHQKLAGDLTIEGRALYKLRPKIDYFDRPLAWIRVTRRDPRFLHCFADIDFVAKLRSWRVERTLK